MEIKNAMNIDPPFILQVGDERQKVTERGRLEFSEYLAQLYDSDDPFGPPVPLASTAQEIRFWIGDRLAFCGGGRGEFGTYLKPDNGLPEIHLNPRFVRAAV